MDIKQVPISHNNYSTRKTKKLIILYHWMAGTLESCDRTFNDPSRRASAHYGIGDKGEIHQYIPEDEISYSVNGSVQSPIGGGNMNEVAISIEHEGGYIKNGLRVKPSQACHDSSVELCVEICKRHGIEELVLGKTAMKHNMVWATQCPGTLDVEYIIDRVNLILKNKDDMDEKYMPSLSYDHPEVQAVIEKNNKDRDPLFSNTSEENLQKFMDNKMFLVMYYRMLDNIERYVDSHLTHNDIAMALDPEKLAEALKPYLSEDVDKKSLKKAIKDFFKKL